MKIEYGPNENAYFEHAIEIVMRRFTALTPPGFASKSASSFASGRKALSGAGEQFWAARTWLSQLQPLKRMAADGGVRSYVVKEWAERQYQTYISNGAFIAAACDLDFKIIERGSDGMIGIRRNTAYQNAKRLAYD